MITYEEYKAAYEAERASAVAGLLCFCVCDHRGPVERLSIVGGPVICPDCHRAGKAHFLTRRPVETYDWDAWEALNPSATYVEAEEYVREVGPHAGPRLRGFLDRLLSGQRLTDPQVEQVIRSKAADKKVDEKAVERIAKSAKRAIKQADLNKVYISPEVVDGDYAVIDDSGEAVHINVERHVEGLAARMVVVTFIVGQAKPEIGFQHPQPRVETPGYRQCYYGPFPHLVAVLVSNPGEAAALYKQLEGVAA